MEVLRIESALVEHGLALVDEILLRTVRSDVAILSQTSRRVVRAGGKRLRPRVLLDAYLALEGQDVARAAPVAAAVELLHTASLIHDDINDHSALRRGQPSVNAELGDSLALLMGDFIFVHFIDLLADFDPTVIRVLSRCCIDIVEGETREMLHWGDVDTDEQTYLAVVAQKTGSLLSAAARLGGILAGGTEAQVEALAGYGLHLGLAFQIRDDLLDFVGNDSALGKPVAEDLGQGKVTLAPIRALQVSPGGFACLMSGDWGRVGDLLRRTGALDYAMHVARAQVHEAKAALQLLAPSDAREELSALADLAVQRCR